MPVCSLSESDIASAWRAFRSRVNVKHWQGTLKSLGFYSGAIDGDPGPMSRGALDMSAAQVYGFTLDRESLEVRPGQFINERTKKGAVVMHHTADAAPSSSVRWWNSTSTRVATAYIVGRDGTVYEVFDPECWAYHTGTGSRYDKQSVGVELTNLGFLKRVGSQYLDWRKKPVAADDVTAARWRGFSFWQSYPEAQVAAAIALARYLVVRFGIDPDVAPPIGDKANRTRFGRFLGIISHAHIRSDKTDTHPGFPWERLRKAVEGE